MKVKHLLESENIEAQQSPEVLYKTLASKCSQFINEFATRGPIIRLDADRTDFFMIKDTPEKRKSHSFIFQNKNIERGFNKLLEEFGHNNRLENVVFGTTIKPTQSSIEGEQYYLFPMNGYSYTYEVLSDSDFHLQNPISEELQVISPILTQNEELYGIYLADEMKQFSNKEVLEVYDHARDVSEMIDRYPFDSNLKTQYEKLDEHADRINASKTENPNLIKFISKLRILVKSIDIIRAYVANKYHTDEITSKLFSTPTEIYFKTDQYIIVSTKFEYDYNELIKNVKQYLN